MRDRALGSTIRLFFNSTNPDAGGAPVAPSSAFAAADVCIWKDGSATQKASAAGITVTSPFDSIVGLHLVEIDTSNNTDSDFWASGSSYSVRLVTAKTVATYSVSGLLIGEFSIELQTADIRKIGGTAHSATDLKDFADTGYDPSTHKLTGAVELDSASVTAVQSGLATSASITALRGADNDTLKTLSDQIDGIDGGAGLTGPYTRTITITDSADDAPIESAKVRLYRTGETETKATDADGETSFTTEAATFSYAVTANGYGGASGTIVINANGATTIELTETSVTPPTNPDLSAVVVSCLGTDFEPESGVTIDLRIKTLPSGSTNTAYPGLKQTATSNGSGIATLEAPKGSVCEWKRGKEDSWTEITIGSDDQTNVTSIIGSRY